ncbi:MAG: LysM peptidoglycan-binding domain-containing protein, partial [Chloroflexi bacterium]|nr:LysM peptidoglycan-binding domain-containing protein [Chloroflexota bacterium]
MNWSLKIARLLLAASFLLALRPPPAQGQTAGPQYIVQPGDTLYGIALQFGLTVEALQAANPAANAAALNIGQALIIPGFEGVTGTLSAHVLEPGESLDSLALRLGLKRETLIRLNRVVNPDGLYIHQPVVIVDALDNGAALPTGTLHAAQPEEGFLALAASLNQNPWALAKINHLPHPGLLAPGAEVLLPGGDLPTRALPFPMRDMQLHPLPPEQGRTVSIHLETAQPVSLTGALGDWPLHFNAEAENSYAALLGIYRLADPDLYRLTLAAAEAGGRTTRFSQLLPVRDGHYLVDKPLAVDPTTIDPAVTGPELAQIQSLVAPYTPTRYWQGLFGAPSVGALRSLFGSLRSYNGGAYDSFHTGVDFSGAEDRPITAPAPGVVVFTGSLTVRGNATLIDHGWGVYSGYWHQEASYVTAGQGVETGDLIGKIGATGRV